MENDFNYTQKFEYLCSLVATFLDREEELDGKGEDHVYQDGLIKTIFGADYSKLVIPKVRESLTKNLTLDTESAQHKAALTRLNILFTTAYCALGSAFMTELKSNLLDALAAANGVKKPSFLWPSRTYDELEKFLTDFPIIIVCMAGAQEYARRLLLHRRRGIQTLGIDQTAAGSRPTGASTVSVLTH